MIKSKYATVPAGEKAELGGTRRDGHCISTISTSQPNLHRRDFVRIGGLSAFGLSLLDWSSIRRAQADEGVSHGSLQSVQAGNAKAKACILIWLDGGPSHLDLFDPKSMAPREVRGPFKPISTAVAGIQVSELLPQTAAMMKDVAIVRSVTSPLGEHNFGTHYLLSGFEPSPAVNYPSIGSVVSNVRTVAPAALPSFVAVPNFRVGGGRFLAQGYLDSNHSPFEINSDPSKSDFRVRDLDPFAGLTNERLRRRLAYQQDFNQFDPSDAAGSVAPDQSFEKAYRLMTSASARAAFDLKQESSKVRRRYGGKTIGQSCLLARRLVERGVPFVTVNQTGWDTHNDMYTRLKEGFTGAKTPVGLGPSLDLAVTALIGDLKERGLFDETLIVVMGEFGRTPKLNTAGGRDHWPRVFSVMMAGAGTPGGQVVGASDALGESPAERPVTPADLAATIYSKLGISPSFELSTADGRPMVVSKGQVIDELV